MFGPDSQLLLELRLVEALAKCVQGKEETSVLASALIRIFSYNNRIPSLMKVLTKRELERSGDRRLTPEENFAEVFRGNSVGCKVVSQYFAQVGRDWARASIQPGVELLAKKGKGRTSPPLYEVDPIAPPEQQSMAIANLSEVVECIVDNVVSTASRAPSELKSLCYDSHPELADQVLGNIIILRFLGPLLTTPGDLGITVNENDLKATRLAAKVLTNLANGILFGGKEEHMRAFNEIATETLNWTDLAQGSEHEKETALKLVFDLNNRQLLPDRRFVAPQFAEFDLRSG